MYYSDKPIDSKGDDQLGRNGFAALLAQSLLNLDTQDTFTVGLFGKWGSGKTSIVNMMLNEIEEQQKGCPKSEKLIVVHFEPWNFSSTDQLLSQFFIRLSNEFRSKGDKRLAEIGEALETYSEAFDLLSALSFAGGGLVSFFGKKGAAAVGNKLKKGSDEKDISKQKEFVIKLLQEQSNRILVVIDDIDRLSNEQIRQVFQLVTSVAKFPNTIYLLVFDKDIVVKALEKVQEGSGRDYLEKIIQMPIQIPDIKPTKLRQILLDRLNVILSKYEGIGFQQVHWQELYEPCIAPFVDSLRMINRLCNAVQFKLSSISTEIDFADIVAISALEIQHPEVYEWVKEYKPLLTGGLDLSTFWERNRTQKDWKDFYSAQIQALLQNNECPSAIDRTEEIISFLSHLFPHFGQKIGEIHVAGDLNILRKGNQIAHPDKFDRYFSLDLDEITIKKAEVLQAAFESDCESLVKTLLCQEESGTSYEFLEELGALLPDFSAERAQIFVIAFLTASPRLNTCSQKNFLNLPASALAEHMVIDLLDIIEPADRFQFISNIITNAELPVLQSLAGVINRLELAYGRLAAKGEERNYTKVITLEELEKIEIVFVEKLKQILTEHSLFDFDEWRLVCHLMECFAPDFMRTYMENELKSNSCIVKYLSDSVAVWIGSGKEYEVNDSYKKYLTEECVLQAIESLKKSGELFTMSKDIQRKCCAFYIYSLGREKNHHDNISENTVNKLLSEWAQ